MNTKSYIYFMHPHVIVIFAFIFLCLETTTANQTLALGGDVLSKCIDTERYALLDFKAHLQDPDGFLPTWTAEKEDCCKWIGVTCNHTTGNVIGLKLPTGDLRGEISPSLLNLTYMNSLDLSRNSFNGTIPRFIGYMTQLTYLDLGGNNFSGTIPPEIGNLTNLQSFFLKCPGRCVIENADWLTRLSKLQELSMNGIFLAKANDWENVIQSLGKLSYLSLEGCDLSQVTYPLSSSFVNSSSPSIVTLNLYNNNLNSSIYRWLFPLTSKNLINLDLSGNMLDGIPEYFGNLCGLISFKFYDNSAVVKLPDFLRNLSGCTSDALQYFFAPSSKFIGSLSDEIQNFSSLQWLYLYDNQLNGTLSDKVWELPMLEAFEVFSNHLTGTISEKIGTSKLLIINLSNNSLEGVAVPSEDHMSNLSCVEYIDLSSCKLGPRFPKWIQKLKNLTRLAITNTRISETIPMEFWDMWPSQLKYLNLSSNNISGNLPDLLSNFDIFSVIDLSSNSFDGPIPNVTSTLKLLNLSGNKFTGGISFLCQLVHGFLEFLDLSNNFLTGQIPDCLWNFKELKVLNLGHNNLSGRLPASIESLFKLKVLYLYKNHLSGELPVSLKNCTSLIYLNLGANNFSGDVPVWIGENLSGLYVLGLRSNNFFGTIPSQLCQLENLQLLDLSLNNLYGAIPSCVNNLTTMVQEGLVLTQIVHTFSTPWWHSRTAHATYIYDEYIDHATIEWQGNVREFSNINLGLLRSIDLSSNNLTGQVPIELTNLYGLLALNLSKNALSGEIPLKIGQLQKLLTLDLSRNNFSGEVPSSMSRMTSLSYLDVSYNNLSGRIPSSTQLQSFEPSRYSGNAGLCGPPVTKNCRGDKEIEVPPNAVQSDQDTEEFPRWFLFGGGIGFATGFSIACGTLVLSHHWRQALFHLFICVKDWVFVMVVVFIAKLRRGSHL
ncbi:probable LRR receptor-like serine/threonine-protein kinase [Tanacetum coccineum]